MGSNDFSHGEGRPPWDASRTTQPCFSPTGVITEDCWYYPTAAFSAAAASSMAGSTTGATVDIE